MIPQLVSVPGVPDLLLPPGVHLATLAEVAAIFALSAHRRWLFEGLLMAVEALRAAGCSRIYLDGSFTSSKPLPGDYDGCWDPTGARVVDLDPVFIDMPASKAAQKARYRGELWQGRHDIPFFDALPNFFQRDDRTGASKGILAIDIRNEKLL